MNFRKIGLLGLAALALLACKKSEESKTVLIDPASVVCNYGDTMQLKLVNGEGDFQWSSDDNYIVLVDSAKGKMMGYHIGTTTIRAKQGDKSATCAVTVNPKSKLYETPYMEWGATQKQVVAQLGEPDTIINSQLIYAVDRTKGIQVNYFIQNDALVQVGVLALNSNYWDELAVYLLERYFAAGSESNVYYFINTLDVKNYSLLVTLQAVTTSSYAAMQVSYMKGTSSAAPEREMIVAAPLR